ncbi:MAG: hypothetical protein KBG28_29665 [Kofleriaceae bacterium]|nr:hypothetical protein [Kofleriaceae bacterium]MBP6840670.1 hypothetical protein [Kofleriaceae bacterium]MBP9208173.1 hypothetical protein [Kofleriaceae bacterium]
MPRPPPDPAVLARFRRLLALLLGGPFVLAVVLTLFRVWPATLLIDWLADEHGRFGLRAVIVGTFVLFGLTMLSVLVPAVVVVTLWRRRRRRG